MADAPDLGSGAARCGGSSPLSRTISFMVSISFDSLQNKNLCNFLQSYSFKNFLNKSCRLQP